MNNKCLYVGTDPTSHRTDLKLVHIPFIEIVARDFEDFKIKHQFEDINDYTHFIFTSKNAVRVFFDALEHYKIDAELLREKPMLVIGEVTSKELKKYGFSHQIVAKQSTQEGIIDLLEMLNLNQAYVFYPRSSKSRPGISSHLKLRGVRYQACDLYDTKTKLLSNLPDLDEFKEVIFTSPTTVDAFFSFFSSVPEHLNLKAIGPVTRHALDRQLS